MLRFLSGGQHCFCALEPRRALLILTPTLQEENNAGDRICAGDHPDPAEIVQIRGWTGFTQEKIPVVSPSAGNSGCLGKGLLGGYRYPSRGGACAHSKVQVWA